MPFYFHFHFGVNGDIFFVFFLERTHVLLSHIITVKISCERILVYLLRDSLQSNFECSLLL